MVTKLEEQVHCCQGLDESNLPWIRLSTLRHLIMVGSTWNFRDTSLKNSVSFTVYLLAPIMS